MMRIGVLSLALATVASAFKVSLPSLPTLNNKVLGSVSVCSSPDALAKNLVADTNITDPSVGDFVGLTFIYDIADDFEGKQNYDCTINGFLPYSASYSLCGDAGQEPCPLLAGSRKDIGAIEVVSGVSKLKCTITWLDAAGNEILCVTAGWTVV